MTWWTCWQKKLADVNEWMICGWSPRPFGSDLCNDERQPWNFPKTLRWFFSFLLRASRFCDTALDFINSRFCSCQVCNSRYFNFKKALGQLGRATPLEFRWHKEWQKTIQFFRQKTIQPGDFFSWRAMVSRRPEVELCRSIRSWPPSGRSGDWLMSWWWAGEMKYIMTYSKNLELYIYGHTLPSTSREWGDNTHTHTHPNSWDINH